MAQIATADPTVFIEDVGAGWVVYHLSDGTRYIIHGVCNGCGECEIGSVNLNIVWTGRPIGEAGACFDRTWGQRRDIPVRPEIKTHCPHCTLDGEYLKK